MCPVCTSLDELTVGDGVMYGIKFISIGVSEGNAPKLKETIIRATQLL